MTPLSPPSQKTLLATLIPLLLAGCGGGSSVDPAEPAAPLSGVFVDSPVSNINYQTKTLKGVTDSNGVFQYMEGETVTFSIGEIEVGRSEGQEQISPLDLVGTEDSENIEVINIARLLQSLDADGEPDNGIEITERAKENALNSVDFAADNFEEQVTNLVANSGSATTELISATQARDHLEAFLEIIPVDSDGDGVRDSEDEYPDNSTESKDTDGDGVGDNTDKFPDDSTETKDTDGDGVGDNADVFPIDGTEWEDSDGDNVGDNSDYAPDNANIQTFCQAEPEDDDCQNNPPELVIATLPDSAAVNQDITLDASNSSDPEGEALTWRWSLAGIDNSTAYIEDDEAAVTTVNVGNLSGTLIINLEVSDGFTTLSTQTSINVTNTAPEVDAGPGQNALINQTIDLFGSATDNETDSESLNYRWSVIPENAGTFGNTESAITTFTFGGDPGGFTLRLTADDGETENFDEILVQSCAATPGTYSMEGTVDTVAAFGIAFGIVVDQQVQWGFDIDSTVTGLVSAGDISGDYATNGTTATADGARFVVWAEGGVGTTPVVPILFNGTTGINSTTMTVDGTNITGGSIEFYGNAGTGQQATIVVDFDAGTFDIWSGTTSFGGDTSNIFYGAGGTINTVTRPNCVGQY